MVLLGTDKPWLFWPWIAASIWLGYVSLRRTFIGPEGPGL
jgi:hypothetical protein